MERQKVYFGSKVQGLSPECLAMELEFDVLAVLDPRLFLFMNSTSGSFIIPYSGFLGSHARKGILFTISGKMAGWLYAAISTTGDHCGNWSQ